MYEPEFEILHFSCRPKVSKDHDYSWYIVNIVFKAYDDYLKSLCLEESKEWKTIQVTDDIEKAEKYFDGIRFEFEEETEENKLIGSKIHIHNDSGYEREDVFRKAYEYDMNTLLQYKEKFDVFCFRSYIEMNSATKGMISYLEEIKSGHINSRFVSSSQLIRTIKALELFWD